MTSMKSGVGSINRICSPMIRGILATSILTTGGQYQLLNKSKSNDPVVVEESQLNLVYSDAIILDMPPEKHSYSGSDYISPIIIIDTEKMKNLSKVNRIANLEDNWNYEGAKAFPETLISSIRQIITGLMIQPEVFPTATESIQLEYEGPDESYLEIEIGETKKASVFSIDRQGNETSSEVDVSIIAINKMVEEFYG